MWYYFQPKRLCHNSFMIPEKLLTYTKTIFEYSHSTVYIKDKNFHYQYMNNRGLKQLQLQEKDIMGMPDKALPF
ncbi:TPA: helix-turn-helix transcriptional regulator, partial [Legionella pneumophila subsp. pneumophila]|nr:helix-turn-helix transcriptional regulator [Legionella pneumophila subsp. pneumophila]